MLPQQPSNATFKYSYSTGTPMLKDLAKKRTYLIKCPSCDGYGWVPETCGVSVNAMRQCPACKGSKVVMATDNGDSNA
jgi:DnaJ-class molecular chaperone